MDDLSGLGWYSPQHRLIFVRSDLGTNRAFTLAHECAHALLGHHGAMAAERDIETEADDLARDMLLVIADDHPGLQDAVAQALDPGHRSLTILEMRMRLEAAKAEHDACIVSAQAPGTMDWYCPWQHLGRLDGVSVRYADLDGIDGLTDFESRTITLRRGMTVAERRTTLAHELVHLERGRVAGHRRGTAEREYNLATLIEERLVEDTAAMRLVPARLLPDLQTLVDRHGDEAACGFLGVDIGALRAVQGLIAEVTA